MSAELFIAHPELAAKVLTVHQRLCSEYGCPVPYFHDIDPLSELVSALLSHRTRNADSGRAFRELKHRFTTWQRLREAPVREIEAAIQGVTWPEQKAPRIQAILRTLTSERGDDMSLDFLSDLPIPEARAWLERLPGIGPKTSAAVLCFSRIRSRALPVDSHHHRVAQRLGLIGAKTEVGPSHAILESLLPETWGPQEFYDHHEVMMFHGQKCCFHHSPACERCVVLDVCPYGQIRMQERETESEKPRKAG